MEAKATWVSKMSFEGTVESGFKLPLGASKLVGGDEDGFRPMELLLIGLAGCTGMDVISILTKKRQDVTAFEVKVDAERAEDRPKVFTKIVVEYILTGHMLDPEAVDRAIELSATKYCSAHAMLGKTASIEIKKTILKA
ncbi:MAG: OsmC family protein [Anaerolineaceae bacterium]|nr:OsmC family protein [Anaerolineaceae bacterium]